MAVMAGVALTGCGHQEDAMRAPLDKIRVVIKQSTSLAVQAACMDGEHRAEMANTHKMISMQPNTNGGMAMKKDKSQDMSPQMKIHVALHDAF